jgi:hypothetical protein
VRSGSAIVLLRNAGFGAEGGHRSRLTGSNAKSAAGGMPKATRSDRTRLIPRTGHSLHFGLSAPPAASQASVPGVASEDKPCSNDRTVGERTALKAIPLNI